MTVHRPEQAARSAWPASPGRRPPAGCTRPRSPGNDTGGL